MKNLPNEKIFITSDWYYTVSKINNRIILIPCEALKKEQRYFLNAIKWSYPLSFDTLKSAKKHTGKKWILKMDIKDFYNSVPYMNIQTVIKNICKKIKNSDDNYYLSLTTLNQKLPTGAPTSSHIANACFKTIDNEIKNYCRIWNVDYSRFVDDLTFSSDDKNALNIVQKRVEQILNRYGYEANKEKTKYISDNKQQNILGLIVNSTNNKSTVRLPKLLKRNIRAMLHNYAVSISKNKTGYFVAESKLKGYISYLKHVDYSGYIKLKNYTEKLSLKYCIKMSLFD